VDKPVEKLCKKKRRFLSIAQKVAQKMVNRRCSSLPTLPPKRRENRNGPEVTAGVFQRMGDWSDSAHILRKISMSEKCLKVRIDLFDNL